MIKINIDWKGKKGFDNLIRYIENNQLYGEMQIAAQTLAHHTADDMINTIEFYRLRPKNAQKANPLYRGLTNVITAERISTTGGIEYGIGNIAKLNEQAPYWEMIDAGATYKTNETHIVPFADGGFRTFKAGSLHTINGINYINHAILNLDKELEMVMKKLGTEFIKGMEKASSGGSTYVFAWGKNVRFGPSGTGGGMGQAR